jgi:hypothetical protein
LADGSVEKYYVELPADIGHIDTLFGGIPDYHGTRQAADLTRHYLERMRELVEEADRRFGSAG